MTDGLIVTFLVECQDALIIMQSSSCEHVEVKMKVLELGVMVTSLSSCDPTAYYRQKANVSE